jgi:putative DNA-invertase from lambdoid prophage Rac
VAALGGDISGNGMSKLFLTIAASFAEAERDRIRERISQVKADQKARGRYLGGTVPFGYRRGESGELVPHEIEQEAIREIAALRAQGRPLRAIADAVRAASRSAIRAWRRPEVEERAMKLTTRNFPNGRVDSGGATNEAEKAR